MHIDKTAVGDIIHKARDAKGLTQAALAEKIDASVRTIIAVEKGKRNPTLEILYKLVHVLNISADLLFYPEQGSYTPEQDQFIREFTSKNENEQQVAMASSRAIWRTMRLSAESE